MKRMWTRLLILALLTAVIPAALLLAGHAMPSCYGETYYAELAPMARRLDRAEGPKLVVIGGSSVAFGLDGALLEELLSEQGYRYTVCPFGLYAAVGTSAMLELSLDALGPGDLVVLAMEPVSEAMSTYFGATAYWKCAEDAPELLTRLNRDQTAALAGSYVTYLQERYAICRSGVLPEAEGAYARSSFDERCDMVYERAGNVMPLGYDTGQRVDLTAVSVEPGFARQVNDWCAAARAKGAQVCLSFAPVNRAALTDDSPGAVAAFFELCNTTFDCPAISDPERYILDSGWSYDSNFHLNSAGARLRTILLAEDILAELGCAAPVYCPRPAMPEPVAAPVTDIAADDSLFTFAAIDGEDGQPLGWLVSGAPEGETLTVPALHAGKPVVGFTGDALWGHTDLRELTLPASVESLPDGLFRDCGGLIRLTLLHTETLCRVTAHTFDGCDALRIFVPAKALPLYRDGRGCEANPWETYRHMITGF